MKPMHPDDPTMAWRSRAAGGGRGRSGDTLGAQGRQAKSEEEAEPGSGKKEAGANAGSRRG